MPTRALKRFLSGLPWTLFAGAALGVWLAVLYDRRPASKRFAAQDKPDQTLSPSDVETKIVPWWLRSTLFGCALAVAALLGWNMKSTTFRLSPPISAELENIRLMTDRISGAPPEIYYALGQPYESSAYHLSQGKRLYSWFGCASCHGDGRGATGPSFLDGWWLYGPEMVSIVSSIRDGRPHGMPPFKHKMTIEQIWQLAGYVQTIGAYRLKVAAPGRNDGKHTRPAENRLPASVLFEEGPVGARVDQGPQQ